jgi:hypothetical protein
MVNKFAKADNKPIKVISTIDPIKEVYREWFGWDGNKFLDHHRKNLNTLKMIWKSASNGPHRWTLEQLQDFDHQGIHSVFIMVREFEEMMDIVNIGKENFGNCQTIQLIRLGLPIPPVEREFLNSHPHDYEYDWSIHNPTTELNPQPLILSAAQFFWNSTSTNRLVQTKLNFNFPPMRYEGTGLTIRDIIFSHEPMK